MNIYEIKENFNNENTEYLMIKDMLYIYEPYKYDQIEIDTDAMLMTYQGITIEIDKDDLSYLLS